MRYEHFTDLVWPSHHDGAQEVGGHAVLVGNDELQFHQTRPHMHTTETTVLCFPEWKDLVVYSRPRCMYVFVLE